MKDNDQIPTAKVRELARLTQEKKDLEAEVKKVAQKINALQASLLINFSRGEVKKLTVGIDDKGTLRTVSLRRNLWAAAKDGDSVALLEYLLANDMKDMTSYQPQKLTAFIREHDEQGKELDKGLAAVVKVAEVFTLVVTKA